MVKLTLTGVKINTNLVWTSHNTGGVEFNTGVFAVYCEYMFVVLNFKIWEHVEFDKGKLLPFLVVYHILIETETWPFLQLLLRMNSSEMQYR